jgi:regulator of protease activity HflC (stomatin/prohibitin superfamily)
VGVQDFFGRVPDRVLHPGINLVVPGTRVVKFSVQTREMKETAAVPTSEGLVVNLDVSLLFRLQPDAAARVYKTIGRSFEGVVIDPQLRSIIRDVTAEYEAKFLYSASREVVAQNMPRGISPELLKWKAIEVAHELSKSPNAKVIVLGDRTGLPIILSDK